MKILAIVFSVLIIFLIVIFLIVYNSMKYTVAENEQAIILQFGKVVGDPIKNPGNYFHIPLIQDAKIYEIEIYSIISLKNNRTMKVRWEISDPIGFYLSGKTEDDILSFFQDILAKTYAHDQNKLIMIINNNLKDLGIEIKDISLSYKIFKPTGSPRRLNASGQALWFTRSALPQEGLRPVRRSDGRSAYYSPIGRRSSATLCVDHIFMKVVYRITKHIGSTFNRICLI